MRLPLARDLRMRSEAADPTSFIYLVIDANMGKRCELRK